MPNVVFQWTNSICCPDCFVRDCSTYCDGVDAGGQRAGCRSPYIWITDDETNGTCYIPYLGKHVKLGEETLRRYPWIANFHRLVDEYWHPTPRATSPTSQPPANPPKAKSGVFRPGTVAKATAAWSLGVVDVDATDITILTTQLFETQSAWEFESFIQLATFVIISMIAIGV